MSGVVPVVQADRDAGAALIHRLTTPHGPASGFEPHHAAMIKEGYRDECATVQAFARHRIAETARLEAEIERLRGALGEETEKAVLYSEERALIVQDAEVNKIVQSRLERGEWLVGNRGYVRARTTLAADTGEG